MRKVWLWGRVRGLGDYLLPCSLAEYAVSCWTEHVPLECWVEIVWVGLGGGFIVSLVALVGDAVI